MNKPKIVGEIMINSSGDLDIMGTSTAKMGDFIIDFAGSLLYYRYSSSSCTGINTGIQINNWYNFEFSDIVKVNGIEKGKINSYDFSNNDQTFYIGKGRNCGYARFKEIKMYDGDTKVRHFIPCCRKSDNILGMFELENNKFYTSKSENNFYYFNNEIKLPNEDSELEYIETTATQYIDTEYIFKNKPQVDGEIMIRSSGDLDIMGNGSAKEGCFIVDFNGAGRIDYRYSVINYSLIGTGITLNTWHTFSFSNKVIIDNNVRYTTTNYDFSNNYQTFYIGKGRSYGYARFKEIKMYDGDALVRDLVPYYKKDVNKVGMLDKLTNVFYSNKGKGEFIAGPEV